MKLKKFVVTVVAILTAAAAFAQNTSDEELWESLISNQVFSVATSDFLERQNNETPTGNDKKIATAMRQNVLPVMQDFCDILLEGVEDEDNVDEAKMQQTLELLITKSADVSNMLIDGVNFEELNSQLNEMLAELNRQLNENPQLKELLASQNMTSPKAITREDISFDYLVLPAITFEAQFLGESGDLSQQQVEVLSVFLQQILVSMVQEALIQ